LFALNSHSAGYFICRATATSSSSISARSCALMPYQPLALITRCLPAA